MEPPERRIIEGEIYGFPVPGSWPGGKRPAEGERDEHLVEVRERTERSRMSWRQQLFGTSAPGQRFLSTPAGEFQVTIDARACTVKGPCSVTIPSPISIGTLRRGVTGKLQGKALEIRRPRYGWRRANRAVEITGPDIHLWTDYRASRRYRIRRRDGSVVYARRARQTFVDPTATQAEVAAAIAVDAADIVATSSLLNFITLP